MTAVGYFDALAQAHADADNRPAPAGHVSWLADKLVTDSLADLRRVGEYEQQSFTLDWRDAVTHRAVTRSIYQLYQQWASEAEQVLDRARRLEAAGTAVACMVELDDAWWRVQARLQLTPEQIERATDQARRGVTIPAEELRHELRARVRA